MAGKISFKTTVYSLILLFSYSLIPMIFSACMNPINITAFLEDPHIQEIITEVTNPVNKEPPKEEPKVKVLDETEDGGLTGGNRKIEGLKAGKYYMVTKELDENGSPVNESDYPKFVTENPLFDKGQLVADLENITIINGGSITVLQNSHTYTVKSATAFPNNTSFTCSGGGITSANVDNNGKLTIIPTTSIVAGDISLTGLSPTYNDCQVMAVAVTPATPLSGWPKTISSTTTSFPLGGQGSTVDYIFYKPGTTPVFKVLTVEVKAPVTNGTANITITFPIDEKANVTGTTTITRSAFFGGTTITLTLDNADWGTISWKINDNTITGTPISNVNKTGDQLTINNSATFVEFFAANEVNVNVSSSISGVPYSKTVKITVTGTP